MITKRGVDNLTKLDPSEYPSLVNEVEGLTNGRKPHYSLPQPVTVG